MKRKLIIKVLVEDANKIMNLMAMKIILEAKEIIVEKDRMKIMIIEVFVVEEINNKKKIRKKTKNSFLKMNNKRMKEFLEILEGEEELMNKIIIIMKIISKKRIMLEVIEEDKMIVKMKINKI